MKYLFLKDQRRRVFVANYEWCKLWLRAIYQNLSNPIEMRSKILYILMADITKEIDNLILKLDKESIKNSSGLKKPL